VTNPADWRRMRALRPVSAAEALLLGAKGHGSQWSFQWAGGAFPVEFKVGRRDHFTSDSCVLPLFEYREKEKKLNHFCARPLLSETLATLFFLETSFSFSRPVAVEQMRLGLLLPLPFLWPYFVICMPTPAFTGRRLQPFQLPAVSCALPLEPRRNPRRRAHHQLGKIRDLRHSRKRGRAHWGRVPLKLAFRLAQNDVPCGPRGLILVRCLRRSSLHRFPKFLARLRIIFPSFARLPSPYPTMCVFFSIRLHVLSTFWTNPFVSAVVGRRPPS